MTNTELEKRLEGLNEEQYKAATSIHGAYRLIAGAGSGKTFTLKKRVAYIVESQHIEPSRVLSLTFTNKAAAEMRQRVADELRIEEDKLQMMTFHRLSLNILKRDAQKVFGIEKMKIGSTIGMAVLVPKYLNAHKDLISGIDDNTKLKLQKYLIMKANKALERGYYVKWLDKIKKVDVPMAPVDEVVHEMINNDLLDKAFKKANEGVHGKRRQKNKAYYTYYEDAATNETNIKDYEALSKSLERDKTTVSATTSWVMQIIKEFKGDTCSFDDLINYALYMLENYPSIRDYWSNQYDYIQVDEFQDTDTKQLGIVKALYERHGNLFVVGDPDQSIYLFRGTEPTLFNELDNYIPSLHTIFMRTNYRSTEEIVNLSDEVITLNKNRIPKTCESKAGKGEKCEILMGTETNSLLTIEFNKIKGLIKQGIAPKDIAILYRSVGDSTVGQLQETLEQSGIPINSTFSYADDFDEFATKICMYDFSKDIIFLELALTKFDKSNSKNVPSKPLDVDSLKAVIDKGIDIDNLLNYIEVTFYDKTMVRADTYKKFLNSKLHIRHALTQAVNTWNILSNEEKEDLCNMSELDDGSEKSVNEEGVQIMTIHKSKGLEFKYVFVNSLTTDLVGTTKSASETEELARLYYVAYSRAKEHLYLCLDSNKCHGVVGHIVDSKNVSMSEGVKEALKETKEASVQNYNDKLGTYGNKYIQYRPLVSKDDKIKGYRLVYCTDGERVAYQARLEDLERLNCVPQEKMFLVQIDKPLQVVKDKNNHLYCYDEIQKSIRVVDCVTDKMILDVFSGSNNGYERDAKDVESLQLMKSNAHVVSQTIIDEVEAEKNAIVNTSKEEPNVTMTKVKEEKKSTDVRKKEPKERKIRVQGVASEPKVNEGNKEISNGSKEEPKTLPSIYHKQNVNIDALTMKLQKQCIEDNTTKYIGFYKKIRPIGIRQITKNGFTDIPIADVQRLNMRYNLDAKIVEDTISKPKQKELNIDYVTFSKTTKQYKENYQRKIRVLGNIKDKIIIEDLDKNPFGTLLTKGQKEDLKNKGIVPTLYITVISLETLVTRGLKTNWYIVNPSSLRGLMTRR